MARAGLHWPEDLKRPIYLNEILPGGLMELGNSLDDYQKRFNDAFSTVLAHRLRVLSGFLGFPAPPNSESDWLGLIIALADHCDLPLFKGVAQRPPGPGAKKKWTDQKLCELFADVRSLVANSELTEHGACKFIATHPARFDRRYTRPNKTQPGDWSRTLHRQFLRAKAKAQSEFAFKLIFLGKGPGLLRALPEYGPELFEIAIERYAVARK